MADDKALGPDGFTMAFFQQCPDIVEQDFVNLLDEFHSNGIISRGLTLSPIPKKVGANSIQDFQPISLVSASYKIISKVLSNRIREVLHEIIDGNQYAFIKGRQIVDSILIANECVEDYRRRKQKGVVLKLDLEKAYDKTDWNFLDAYL